MSVQIELSNSASKKFIVELEYLPTTITIPADTSDKMGHLWAGLFFTIFGFFLAYTHVEQSFFHPNVIAGLFMGGFGAMNIARMFKGTRGEDVITFHKTYVEVEEQHLFRTKRWRENYSAFKGVGVRTAKRSKKKSLRPYKIIELIHEEASKTLPLYAQRKSSRPNEELKQFSKILNVEILD